MSPKKSDLNFDKVIDLIVSESNKMLLSWFYLQLYRLNMTDCGCVARGGGRVVAHRPEVTEFKSR